MAWKDMRDHPVTCTIFPSFLQMYPFAMPTRHTPNSKYSCQTADSVGFSNSKYNKVCMIIEGLVADNRCVSNTCLGNGIISTASQQLKCICKSLYAWPLLRTCGSYSCLTTGEVQHGIQEGRLRGHCHQCRRVRCFHMHACK